jgi:hypothetical protein
VQSILFVDFWVWFKPILHIHSEPSRSRSLQTITSNPHADHPVSGANSGQVLAIPKFGLYPHTSTFHRHSFISRGFPTRNKLRHPNMKVLVIGSGGREHALAERLAKSDKVTKIYLAPGKFSFYPSSAQDIMGSKAFCFPNISTLQKRTQVTEVRKKTRSVKTWRNTIRMTNWLVLQKTKRSVPCNSLLPSIDLRDHVLIKMSPWMAEVDRFSSAGTGTRFNQWNRRPLSQDWGTMFRPK